MKGGYKSLMLGMVIGAAAVLVFSPKKGSKLRVSAAKGARKFVDVSQGILDEIRERLEQPDEYEQIMCPEEEIIISREYKEEVDEYER